MSIGQNRAASAAPFCANYYFGSIPPSIPNRRRLLPLSGTEPCTAELLAGFLHSDGSAIRIKRQPQAHAGHETARFVVNLYGMITAGPEAGESRGSSRQLQPWPPCEVFIDIDGLGHAVFITPSGLIRLQGNRACDLGVVLQRVVGRIVLHRDTDRRRVVATVQGIDETRPAGFIGRIDKGHLLMI